MQLDFCNAIRDIRRFAYVSKLIHLLIQENLTSLSGNATKALFWMLEEIAKQVSSNKQNINVIKELLAKLKEIFDQYLCWGRPLGSTILWEQHFRRMERIIELTEAIEIIPSKNHPCILENPDLTRQVLIKPSSSSLPDNPICSNSNDHNAKVSPDILNDGQFSKLYDSTSSSAQPLEFHRELGTRIGGRIPRSPNIDINRTLPPRSSLPSQNDASSSRRRNIPFFEHPLVIQRLNSNADSDREKTKSEPKKASLHVPITPQAFLKFFSL
ncbi:hypothetical protein QR98_0039910 [Sarcoptes scabiei]|uniref:Uncharacterized protein n=1 Tax=Sarcoptes scabiei TaxID=52283 RepID=A0A132A3F7_SARSC|nr:hypothetical protein QR98_0039910 [Sarcoptes scabiei]